MQVAIWVDEGLAQMYERGSAVYLSSWSRGLIAGKVEDNDGHIQDQDDGGCRSGTDSEFHCNMAHYAWNSLAPCTFTTLFLGHPSTLVIHDSMTIFFWTLEWERIATGSSDYVRFANTSILA
jgi:hypothetical protein